MITARWTEGDTVRRGSLADIPAEPTGMVWVDVSPPDAESLAAVAQHFSLPPLAVEDCLHFPQRPKLDIYGDLSFIVWLIPYFAASGRLEAHELDVFLGQEHLITVHSTELDSVERLIAHAADNLGKGAEWTLHAILDGAVDSVLPAVEQLSDDLEELEDLMFSQALPEHQQRLYTARRTLVQLHRIIAPERDVIRALARLEAFIEPAAYMYFQDIGDHLARVADEVDTYREVANGTMDIYLSAQSNRMNAIMKTLTIVTTIFMPLTLISGIYGMNFVHMPGLEWEYGYFATVGTMVLIAVSMIIFFWRNKWW